MSLSSKSALKSYRLTICSYRFTIYQDTSPVPGRQNGSGISAAVNARQQAYRQGAAQIGASADAPPAKSADLSVRAENVLKELAVELTGENPPKGRWIPSSNLLRKLTFRHLLTARNCGPQTTDEIVRWAESRGVVIRPPFHAGKSLPAIWRDLIVKCSKGEITKAEIAEALEKSARRKNTRIPVAFQAILLQILSSS